MKILSIADALEATMKQGRSERKFNEALETTKEGLNLLVTFINRQKNQDKYKEAINATKLGIEVLTAMAREDFGKEEKLCLVQPGEVSCGK